MDKDTSRSSTVRAVEAARAAQADLLIGVGAGSVIQGTRVVAILLAETRPIEELITQYPENGPAISPRLMERKLPIINVLTAPTSAQNRGGSRMKDDETVARHGVLRSQDAAGRDLLGQRRAAHRARVARPRDGGAAIFCRTAMNLGGTAHQSARRRRPAAGAPALRAGAAAARRAPTRRRAALSSCAPRRSCRTATPTTAAA